MKRKIIPFLTVLLVSCSSSPEITEHVHKQVYQDSLRAQVEHMDSIAQHPQRTKEEAIDATLQFLAAKGSPTRSSVNKSDIRVDSLTFETKHATRNSLGEETTDVYVCNIGKQEGYVLVSGDRRTEELLAYVPSGTFQADDISENHPVNAFFECLPDYLVNEKAQFEKDRQESINKLKTTMPPKCKECIENNPPSGYDWKYGNWIDQPSDALHLVPFEWDQDRPYNYDAPEITYEGFKMNALSGCVAVAVCQFLAYHRYPASIGGKDIDWKVLCAYRRAKDRSRNPFNTEVARLLRAVGDKLHNEWGHETSAANEDVPGVLKEFGYILPACPIVNYDESILLESLHRKLPVIASGDSHKYTYKTGVWPFRKTHVGYSGGHEWLIDGYLVQKKTDQEINRKTGEITYHSTERLLVHCNWGWEGFHNGYFLSGVFNTTNEVRKDKNEDAEIKETRSPESKRNYQYRITIIPNVHK